MMASTWIQAIILGLSLLHSTGAQSCSTPFRATYVTITRLGSTTAFFPPDPNYTFYRETLCFSDAEVEQEKNNAIQYFKTQFGLDFSNAEPNERGQRFVGNASFEFNSVGVNFTAVANNWLVSGNTRSRCFNIGGAGFEAAFNATVMLHGVYGGEQGKPAFDGDTVTCGYFIIYDAIASSHQPILIQSRSEVPSRTLPVEGWFVEELILYNRWLGQGRLTGLYRNFNDAREVISFP